MFGCYLIGAPGGLDSWTWIYDRADTVAEVVGALFAEMTTWAQVGGDSLPALHFTDRTFSGGP